MTAVNDRFSAALLDANPVTSLRRTVQELVNQGEAPEVVYDQLQSFALELRAAGSEVEEEIVFDVMDMIVGWCSPERRIHLRSGAD